MALPREKVAKAHLVKVDLDKLADNLRRKYPDKLFGEGFWQAARWLTGGAAVAKNLRSNSNREASPFHATSDADVFYTELSDFAPLFDPGELLDSQPTKLLSAQQRRHATWKHATKGGSD